MVGKPHTSYPLLHISVVWWRVLVYLVLYVHTSYLLLHVSVVWWRVLVYLVQYVHTSYLLLHVSVVWWRVLVYLVLYVHTSYPLLHVSVVWWRLTCCEYQTTLSTHQSAFSFPIHHLRMETAPVVNLIELELTLIQFVSLSVTNCHS